MAKILVVDDEVNIRRMIRKFAEFEGYEVFEAVDGMDAVEKWSANQRKKGFSAPLPGAPNVRLWVPANP